MTEAPLLRHAGESRGWRWGRVSSLAGIVGLTVIVRLLRWPSVFAPEGVYFVDGDGYYHMRRIWHSISHFPTVLDRDPLLNFPHGGESPWPPGFDWLVAAVLKLLVGSGDVGAAERASAFVPVVFAAVTVVLVVLLTARMVNWKAGAIAGLLYGFLPAAYLYNQLGFLDHHAAVAVFAALILGGCMHLLPQPDTGDRRWPLAAGVLAGSALLTWPGAMLHLAAGDAALIAWTLSSRTRDVASGRAVRLAVAHAIAALMLLPFGLGRSFGDFGSFTPLALTTFQPTFFASGAVCLAAAALLWRSPPLGSSLVRRNVAAALCASLGLLLAFSLISELGVVLSRSAGWFTGDEVFHDRITELTPLFGRGESLDFAKSLRWFGFLFFAFPAALFVLIARAPRAIDRWMLLAWSLVFGLACLSQNRFINTFSVAFVMVWGGGLAEAIDWVRERTRDARALRRVGFAVGIVLLLLAVYPVSSYFRPQWALLTSGIEGASRIRMHRLHDAARWIARASPAPATLDATPESGVLCAWGVGHEIRYYSGHGVVQDNFGPYVARENVALASRYYETDDESEALQILEGLRVRWVVVDRAGAGMGRPYPASSLTTRMSTYRGAAVRLDRSSSPTDVTPALERHRLVFETPGQRRAVKVFEIVEGARFEGRAEPGSTIRIRLPLESEVSRFEYRAQVEADESGRFFLRLPYSTEDLDTFVAPRGAYRLRIGDDELRLAVPERAVREGGLVAREELRPHPVGRGASD